MALLFTVFLIARNEGHIVVTLFGTVHPHSMKSSYQISHYETSTDVTGWWTEYMCSRQGSSKKFSVKVSLFGIIKQQMSPLPWTYKHVVLMIDNTKKSKKFIFGRSEIT